MLSNKHPNSFLSGAKIDTSLVLKKGSRHEFHHIFPRKYLETIGVDGRDANVLANICFLNRADNNKISAKPPAQYFRDMNETSRNDYLEKALCEIEDGNLDYPKFVEQRSSRLIELAKNLCGVD